MQSEKVTQLRLCCGGGTPETANCIPQNPAIGVTFIPHPIPNIKLLSSGVCCTAQSTCAFKVFVFVGCYGVIYSISFEVQKRTTEQPERDDATLCRVAVSDLPGQQYSTPTTSIIPPLPTHTHIHNILRLQRYERYDRRFFPSIRMEFPHPNYSISLFCRTHSGRNMKRSCRTGRRKPIKALRSIRFSCV